MNAKQFSTNLTSHRRKNHFSKKHSNLKEKDEDFLETNKMMTAQIFKNKKELTETEFCELKNGIQEILWHYEFFQLNVDENDKVSAHDFAHSLIVYFPFAKFQEYLNHLE